MLNNNGAVGPAGWNTCKRLFSDEGHRTLRLEALGPDWLVVRDIETQEAGSATFESTEELTVFLTQFES